MGEQLGFRPEWAAAPGLTIAHVLKERGMTYEDLAVALEKPKRFVTGLVAGREEIDAAVAEALAHVVGSTGRFWLAREREYRESLRRIACEDAGLSQWVSELPLQDMRRLGWIRQTSETETIAECLGFFGVSSLERWRQAFESAVVAAAFRSSAAHDTDAAALSAWLRQGELLASAMRCSDWDPESFRSRLREARRLTRVKSAGIFMPELQRLCSECGVAVVVVPAPKGCRASGVARFTSPDRALIQLSLRYGTDDQFWFTFFHEAGHLLLHSKLGMFIDEDETSATREEAEANEFASSVLLTPKQRSELALLPFTYKDVIRFAREVGLSPGIIAGQLQHSKRIGYGWLNKAKRKIDWSDLED